MKKFDVYTQVVGSYHMGQFEAETEEEAIKMAWDKVGSNNISLCYHCSHEVGELYLSDNDEDIEAIEKYEVD